MLIIAIPKSASSSLMKTLSERHGLPAEQVMFPDLPVPKTCRAVWKLHSDMRELTEELAARFADGKKIYKQHILPTSRNLELLRDHKKVVLLRSPEEIIASYRRGVQKMVTRPLEVFAGCRTVEDWQRRAEDIGVLDDLRWFYDTWGQEGADRLVLTYDQVVNQTTQTVAAIEVFWDLPQISCPATLARQNYARIGSLRTMTRRIRHRVKKILVYSSGVFRRI